MKDIKTKFGQKIKKIRTEKGLSQEQLASICCLHRTYISDIERGRRNVSIENVGKIAHALKINPSELLNFN